MKRYSFIIGCSALFVIGLVIGNTDTVADQSHLTAGLTKQSDSTKDRRPSGPTAYESALREVASDRQSNFDEGIAFPAMDTTFEAFDNAWDISDILAQRLDLNRSERSKAQQAIDLTKFQFDRLVSENSSLDRLKHDASEGSLTYRVRPFIRSGHNELENLHDRLVKLLGDERGNELFRYVRWRPHLGAYGANDVEITFYPSGGNEPSKVRFTRRKSTTGITISGGTYNEEQLLDYQGYKRSMFR